MSVAATVTDKLPAAAAAARRNSVLLVFCCTLFGAAAQMLIKPGAEALPRNVGLLAVAWAMLTNMQLLIGYSLYGINTVLMVMALKKGELSLLYPIISLTYIWVTILSVWVRHESMNPLKAVGILVIVAGVAVLGRGERP